MATRGASLKMVKEIHAAFDPFASSAVAIVREFVRRVSSPKLLETNTKFKLSTEVKSDGSEPYIKITYVDKDSEEIYVQDGERFEDVYSRFIRTCKQKES